MGFCGVFGFPFDGHAVAFDPPALYSPLCHGQFRNVAFRSIPGITGHCGTYYLWHVVVVIQGGRTFKGTR